MVSDKMIHKAFRIHKTQFEQQKNLRIFFFFIIYQLYIGFNFFSPPEYSPRPGIKWKRI